MNCPFDRVAEDLGNIVALEHVNVTVPDQDQATLFYVAGLGLTCDPFLMTGIGNTWINVGRGQFHLPTNGTQVLRGHIGLVLPDRPALLRRLTRIRKRLEGSCLDFREHDEFVEARCPWGNRIRCFEAQEKLGRIRLGLSYVEFDVPGNAEGIRGFYHEITAARAGVSQQQGNRFAQVEVGVGQRLVFRETDRVLPSYRNPSQSNLNYAPGYDAWIPGMPLA